LESVDLRYRHQVIVNPDSTQANAKLNASGAQDGSEPPAGAAHQVPQKQKKVALPNKTKKHT
jgi:hypothetical protein